MKSRGTLLAKWSGHGKTLYFPEIGGPITVDAGEILELWRVPRETQLREAIQSVLDSADAQNANAIIAAIRDVIND